MSASKALLALALLASSAGAVPVVNAIIFDNYPSPTCNVGQCSAGETSIGVNPRTNHAFFLETFRVTRIMWNDAVSPPAASWLEQTPPFQVVTFDPILYTDRTSGRTFVVQNIVAGSQVYFTQDLPGGGGDGNPYWLPTQIPTTFPFFDHQTMGSGPHFLLPNPDATLPNEVDGALNAAYYCAQLIFPSCTRSDDGGLTWGPYTVVTPGTCGGLTGHIVVGRDGTAYLPNGNCGTNGQAVTYTKTNGLTWVTVYLPGSLSQRSDPAVAVDSADNVYVAMGNGGVPMVSKSTTRGASWSDPVSVDTTATIRNVEFPMMVAGGPGRIAMAYYGTTTAGDDQSSSFQGVWHLYVSISLDGGATWTQTDVTPNDPVQRGCIWLQGGNNACRNLLDFQGATLDAFGRILVGYADGCTSTQCVGPNGTPADSRASKGVIARLSSGPLL
jgi:hypothetical protein